MTRLATTAFLTISTYVAFAADPIIDPIDRALLVQKAMADAKDLLAANDPSAASAALEAQLPHANVNRSYLDLLRKSYDAELTKLRNTNSPDLKRLDAVAKRLAILDGTRTEPSIIQPVAATVAAPETDWLKAAGKAFNLGTTDPSRYREAAELFAKANRNRVAMTPEQLTAWAYCRVKLAAEEMNEPTATAESATAIAADIRDALALAPGNAGLQKAGQDVLSAVRSIAGSKPAKPANGEWATVEGVGAIVKHRDRPDLAAAVAKAAETLRQSISSKWFGPAGAAWNPKCEITIHPTAAAFAVATGMSEKATGRAEVSLENNAVTRRQIDLRADDESLRDVALPRELTHVVLADIFPTKPPPRWAEEAMALLSTTPAEAERYRKAVPRLAADGALPTANQLLTSTGFPAADRITGFYVASLSLVEFLIERKGERTFAAFLTDGQRYGIETALRRQYNLTPAQLDDAWRRAALTTARGQRP